MYNLTVFYDCHPEPMLLGVKDLIDSSLPQNDNLIRNAQEWKNLYLQLRCDNHIVWHRPGCERSISLIFVFNLTETIVLGGSF